MILPQHSTIRRHSGLLWVLFLLANGLGYGMPSVVSVSPVSESIVPVDNVEIMIQFASAITPGTLVPGKNFLVMGHCAGVLKGNLSLTDGNKTAKFLVTSPISVGEVISVNLAKEIDAGGYHFWEFNIATGKKDNVTLTLKETIQVYQPPESHTLRTYGANAGDLNQDGWHDLTTINEDADDIRIFMGAPGGAISKIPLKIPIPRARPQQNARASTNEMADLDLDGDLDLAIGQINGSAVSVYLGDGKGNLTFNKNYPVGGDPRTSREVRGLCALDLNGDNYYDLVSANRVGNNITILINNGNGTFKDSVNMESGVLNETGCTSGDFNEDGWEDVAIGGYGIGTDDGAITILLSDGKGGLQPGTPRKSSSPWMIRAGDFDADKKLDVIAVNNKQGKFSWLKGDGKGNLADGIGYLVGAGIPGLDFASLAIGAGDLNGDGLPEVATSDYGVGTWTIYENMGGGIFGNKKTYKTPSAGSDAVFYDRDHDGDLDMTGIDEEADLIQVFENPGLPLASIRPYQIMPMQLRSFRFDPIAKAFAYDLNAPSRIQIELLGTNGTSLKKLRIENTSAGKQTLILSNQDIPVGVQFYRVNVDKQSFQNRFVWLR